MMQRLVVRVQWLLDSVRVWLDRHPRIDRSLERTGCLRFGRRYVARGVGVGLFVALTPTVGVQTAMMLGACLLVRANFPAAFVISWISNPVTMAPLYWAYNQLGERVFSPIVETGLDLAGYGEKAAVEVLYVALGSLMVATPLAVAGYGLTLWGWRSWVVHRRRQGLAGRKAGRAARDRTDGEGDDASRRREASGSDESHH